MASNSNVLAQPDIDAMVDVVRLMCHLIALEFLENNTDGKEIDAFVRAKFNDFWPQGYTEVSKVRTPLP